MNNAILDSATSIAELGWKIFPCVPGGKKPITRNGFKNATDDYDQIVEWFDNEKGYNLGLWCGGSGLVGIDIDPRDGGEETLAKLVAELGELPPTVTQLSPSSDHGRHLIFRHPGHPIRATLGAGIDTRDQGYLMVTPSVHPCGGRYAWAPSLSPWDIAPAELPAAWMGYVRKPEPKAPRQPNATRSAELTPWDDYAERGDIGELLSRHGWTFAGEGDDGNLRWTRPGKTSGVSATYHPVKHVFYVFSSAATPFERNQAYSPHAVYAMLECGGDFALATKQLYAAGFGKLKEFFDGIIAQSSSSKDQPEDSENPPFAGPLPPITPASSCQPSWEDELLLTRKGVVKGCLHNAMVFLSSHPTFAGKLAFNSRSLDVTWISAPPWDVSPRVARDTDAAELVRWLGGRTGAVFSASQAWEAIRAVAEHQCFDPVKDWLESLVWDGVDRTSRWLCLCYGAEICHLNEVFGRKWLISAVARVYEPGCQADHMLVLQGAQKIGKTQSLSALAGKQWHSELRIDPDAKDSLQDIHGPWIVEWGELAGIGKRDVEAVKLFISRRIDRFRPSYGRSSQDHPRRCIFAATTNENFSFSDPTGARRFWPVHVERFNAAWLELCREQLWAEAVARYQAGEPWWLTGADEALVTELQGECYQADPWEQAILEALTGTGGCALTGIGSLADRNKVTSKEILESLGVSTSKMTVGMDRAVSRILSRFGWKRGRITIGGRKVRVYLRPDGFVAAEHPPTERDDDPGRGQLRVIYGNK